MQIKNEIIENVEEYMEIDDAREVATNDEFNAEPVIPYGSEIISHDK